MLRRKTLFIVGAGASSEVGLPVGSKLLDAIGTSIGIDNPGVVKNFTIQQALQQLSNFHGNTLEFYSAAALINRNINQVFSIDTFLDAHSDNQYVTRVGKMLIAYVILKAERSSTLMINPTDHPGATLAVFAHSPLFG